MLAQVFARVYGHVADPHVSNPAQTEKHLKLADLCSMRNQVKLTHLR